jgi:hypothetical protein
LNLIKNEQYVIRAAKLTHLFEPTRRWNDNPGLTLDRLDQHGDRLGRQRALHCSKITEWDPAKPRRERAEPVAIGRLRREADDGRGAAVEVPVGDDNARLVARHPLNAITPTARRLDGGLDRLRARVHGQRGVETGQATKLSEEGPETVVVVGARRHRETVRLLGQGIENARMGVTVTVRRIGAHHVDVAAAGSVKEMRALAAGEHHGEGIIIARAVATLGLDRLHDTLAGESSWTNHAGVCAADVAELASGRSRVGCAEWFS